MEQDFLGRFIGKFPGATKHLKKGSPVFPEGIFQTEIRVPFLQSHKSLIPGSDLRGSFLVNGTDMCNDKRDSGTKFTSPEFCAPFAQTVDRPARPCKW